MYNPDVLPLPVRSQATRFRSLWAVLYNIAFAFVALELLFAIPLRIAPSVVPYLPDRFVLALRYVYLTTRDTLQTSLAFVRYDPEVTYTLRPGTFTFANAEFRNVFHVNHAGFRDDEAALDAPDTVVLGDSFAMGWGVDQDQTFAQILERRTGRTVLNTGVSSYATVREMRILHRIDTSKLRTLIVQYSNNDAAENAQFVAGSGSIRITAEIPWKQKIAAARQLARYYPGQFVFTALEGILLGRLDRWRNAETMNTSGIAVRKEADDFLQVLAAGLGDRPDVTVVLFDVRPPGQKDRHVMRAISSALARHPGMIRARRVIPLDLSDSLTPDLYYRLDNHLNAAGHARVAEEILRVLSPEPTKS